MTRKSTLELLDASGEAAPPRDNGELVFAEPWESRVFGLTVALCDRDLFTWDEFRERLIAEIAVWERAHASDGAPYRYYEQWQAALETLLVARNICPSADLDEREQALAARPAGHDH